MAIRPDQITLRPDQVARCQQLLAAWDARNPWAPVHQQLGAQLTGLAFEVCAPQVPRLETPEQAAKFIREAVTATAARADRAPSS
jgi:hypothetical protein